MAAVMSDSYPIIEVHEDWILEEEDLGTKEKFWYRRPGEHGKDWLFKMPRQDTGEHWAEKIAAEVATLLGVAHASVELAVLRDGSQERRGSVSESFVSANQELWHGNQIMEWAVAEYDPSIRRGQSDHSLENIWDSFGRVFVEPGGAREARVAFAGYLVLDAVIGNTDRHHENWGLLIHRVGDRRRGRLAPSFDHASSLGRELLDTRRAMLLQENRVGWYSKRGRGGIYWGRHKQVGASPIGLVRRAAEDYPAYFAAFPARLARLRSPLVREIVDRVPADWMSDRAREFAVHLVADNRRRLLEVWK